MKYKNLKSYIKPLLKKHGNINEITKGAWKGDGDGIPGRYDSD